MDVVIKYFLAMFFMLGVLLIWYLVQRLARQFAANHPEFGKIREEGSGCGGGGKCNCRSVKDCLYPKGKKGKLYP